MFTLDFFGWTNEDWEDYIDRCYKAEKAKKEKDATAAEKELNEKEIV